MVKLPQRLLGFDTGVILLIMLATFILYTGFPFPDAGMTASELWTTFWRGVLWATLVGVVIKALVKWFKSSL